MEVEPLNLKRLDEEFGELEERIGVRIKAYYKTLCSKCMAEGAEDANADAIYIFWVKKVPCVTCSKEVRLY